MLLSLVHEGRLNVERLLEEKLLGYFSYNFFSTETDFFIEVKCFENKQNSIL